MLSLCNNIFIDCQAHLQLAQCQRTILKAAKEPDRKTSILPRQNYCETTWLHPDSFKISTKPNSVGLINWLRQPGLLFNRPPKSIREKFNQLIKSCGTWTVPAAETKSIGLPAYALVPCLPAGR
jgi:hypothetical protein